jgi:hypothetical protein
MLNVPGEHRVDGVVRLKRDDARVRKRSLVAERNEPEVRAAIDDAQRGAIGSERENFPHENLVEHLEERRCIWNFNSITQHFRGGRSIPRERPQTLDLCCPRRFFAIGVVDAHPPPVPQPSGNQRPDDVAQHRGK